MKVELYNFLKSKGYDFCYLENEPFLAGHGNVSIKDVEEYLELIDKEKVKIKKPK